MDNQYLEWLHDLTALGYEKGITIPAELEEEVKKCYSGQVSPKIALDTIIGLAHFKGISIHDSKPLTSGRVK